MISKLSLRFCRWLSLLGACASLLSGISYSQEPARAVEVGRSEVILKSPLYEARFDLEHGMLARLECTITAEDIQSEDVGDPTRAWWTPKALKEKCLSNNDYLHSGYDRGHVRAMLWSNGRENWPDVNCMPVIVPQWPEVNRGTIKNLEQHIADLAVEHGSVFVRVDCLFTAEEPKLLKGKRVPDAFRYLVIPGAGSLAAMKQEIYSIPNSPTVKSDFKAYRVDLDDGG